MPDKKGESGRYLLLLGQSQTNWLDDQQPAHSRTKMVCSRESGMHKCASSGAFAAAAAKALMASDALTVSALSAGAFAVFENEVGRRHFPVLEMFSGSR